MDFFTSRFSGSNAGPVHLQDDNATVANNNSDVGPSSGNPFRAINSFFTSRPLSLGAGESNTASVVDASDDTDSILKLSYFERISLFIVCILGCYACYAICFIFFPVLSLKPKKFSLIWTIGSVLFLVAFAILNGPTNFFKHAISVERLPFTLSFVGSIVTTLLFSLVWKNNLLVIISCVIQAICSVYYTVSYFPYGRQGLRLTTGVARSQVENWLSV